MAARNFSAQESPMGSLHSRRNVLKNGALVAGALLVPWRPRWARAQSVTFDYYISPTGSDSNPGTQAAPWAITAINTKQSVYSGKRVGLLDGTYPMYTLCNNAGGYLYPALLVNGSSDPANPTVIQAVNRGMAILDAHQTPGTTGAGYPTANSPIIGVGQGNFSSVTLGNVIIDGLVCTGSVDYCIHFFCKNSNTQTVSSGKYSGVQYGGATGIIVRNCEVYDVSNQSFGNNPNGIGFYYCTGHQVTNCRIHPMESSTAAGCQGILTFSCYQGQYTYNTIYGCGSAIEEKEGPQGGSTYAYNYLEGFDIDGLGTVRDAVGGLPGWTTTFHHNIVVSSGGDGWNTNDSTNPSQFTQESILCYNNTFYDASEWSTSGFICANWGAGDSTSPAASLTHYNNIYFTGAGGSSGSDVIFAVGPGCIALSNYNSFRPNSASTGLLFTEPAGTSVRTGYTLSAWRSSVGQDANSIAANPAFVNPTIAGSGGVPSPAGFQLAGTYGNTGASPCAGAGRVGGASSGTACNMGAWDGSVTQIGCDFGAAKSAASLPDAPVLSVS